MKIFGFQPGFKEKLLLVIFLIGAIGFSILAVNRVLILQGALRNRTVFRMDSIGNILSAELLPNLENDDQLGIRLLLATTTQQPLVDFVLVVDPKGRVLFSSELNLEGKVDPYPDTNEINYFGPDQHIRSFPLKKKDLDYGYLKVGFSLAQFKSDIRDTLAWSAGLSSLILLFMLVSAWLITTLLLRPLVEVKNALRSIANGDFGKRVLVQSEDVIGELCEGLNIAAEKLEDLTVQMQKKIDLSTCQLKGSNQVLFEQKQKLEEANRKLTELDKIKSEFIATASYELKTPLTGLVGLAGNLLNLDLPEAKKKDYLRAIDSEGRRMALLIDEFLEIAMIESGSSKLQLSETNIADIIERAINAAVKDKNIKIETNISTIQPFLADPDRLERVILNLLSNAVRYNKLNGKVTIKAVEEGGQLVVSVRDEGPGIPRDYLGQIFDKFYRRDDEITKKHNSIGLGLSLAKDIIVMHKGSIWADSKEGKGSTFTFMIPLKRIK